MDMSKRMKEVRESERVVARAVTCLSEKILAAGMTRKRMATKRIPL